MYEREKERQRLKQKRKRTTESTPVLTTVDTTGRTEIVPPLTGPDLTGPDLTLHPPLPQTGGSTPLRKTRRRGRPSVTDLLSEAVQEGNNRDREKQGA